ncbi:hypothetical protein ACM66B_001586 [Microbotryomycetes sp. NB124-2]
MATRDKKTGNVIQGAHIMGTFRRIMKLLFHGIKPVFVFDGEAPALKRRTLEGRRRRKEGAGQNLQRTAKALLSAQLRAHLVKEEAKKEKARAEKQGMPAPDDTGDQIGGDVVYLEDLEAGTSAARPRRQSTPAQQHESVLPASPAKKYVPKDQYALPAIAGSLESRAKASDIRIATAQEQQDFLDELRPDFFDSEEFASLATELKYEIIGEQRLKSRQVNHRRVHQMKTLPTALDFSQSQIANLMERNAYTQKLLEVTDELGSAKILVPTRVAGERSKAYALIKQDPSKGTGYVLGVQNPELNKTDPIVIDSTTSEDGETADDSDDMEEVAVQETRGKTPPLDRELRQVAAMEAIRARLGPAMPDPDHDPLLDGPRQPQRDGQLFRRQAQPPAQVVDARPQPTSARVSPTGMVAEEDDPALQEALVESALLAKISEAVRQRRQASEARSARAASPLADPDDELDYVEATKPAPFTTNKAPSVIHLTSDDSDSFEEVPIVAPKIVHAPELATAVVPGTSQAAAMPQRSNGLKREQTAAVRKSLMEAVLRSEDEESDEFEEVTLQSTDQGALPAYASNSARQTAQAKAPRRVLSGRVSAPKAAAPGKSPSLSPDVDDFVVARDFGMDAEPQSARQANPRQNVRIVGQVSSTGAVDLPVPDSPMQTVPEFEQRLERVPVDGRVRVQRDEQHPAPYNLDDRVAAIDQAALPNNVTRSEPLNGQVLGQSFNAPALAAPFELASSRQFDDDGLPPLPDLPPLPAEYGGEIALADDNKKNGGDQVALTAPKSDEEEYFEWEKSPTPPSRRASDEPALFRQAGSDDDFDYDAEEEMEMVRNYEREQAQYADMLSQLKNRKIEDMLSEAKNDVDKLIAQRNAEQRNAEGVTKTMSADIQEMLMLFGIPYVTAPQEAEAECADMLSREFVDGIVTDDSDVFLFGGTRVYRHMFNDNKVVECYLMSDLERELGLDRKRLVNLAYLLGGDYADGLKGIGPVQGRELLAEFDSDDGIKEFKEWWQKVQEGRDDKVDTSSPFRRRFKKSHRKLVIDDNWPNPDVAKAYLKPVVSEHNEAFEWGSIDLDGLRLFLQRMLTWNNEKTSELLLPLIKRQQARAQGQLKHQSFLSD